MADETAKAPQLVLVIDDEEVNLILLERILSRADVSNAVYLQDPREALAYFEENPVDLVLTDLHMPYVDGFEVIRRVRELVPAGEFLPVAMLTADLSPEAEARALELGANEFLNKPFRAAQVALRVQNLLRTRRLHRSLAQQNERLEARVRERTAELQAAQADLLDRLALAAEYRDRDTGEHTRRVGLLTERLALRLGLPAAEASLLGRAAPLHDVGKIGIPDAVLLKPARLSSAEFEVIKRHVKVGVQLLARGQSALVQTAELIALTHHERYDGSGYPRGLAGEGIPLAGRIVAVVDVFDTLVARRPYKAPWPRQRAVEELRLRSGSWFDPRVVDAFLAVLEEDSPVDPADAALPDALTEADR